MAEVHHFEYGLVTPVLAYVMSCVGSLLGLLCTARARGSTGPARTGWLAMAALSIGGTGIWVMHFIAMIGFRVPGWEIRYDVVVTLVSALVSVGVVGVGVFAVGYGRASSVALLAGGTIMGLGVASMHYLGMAAMRMSGHIGYTPGAVIASVLIAVAASTVALWFTLRVRGAWATGGAALIMGVAVSGMHYTAMAAVQVRIDEAIGAPAGAKALDFLLPLIIGISLVAIVLLTVIAVSPSEQEMRREQELLDMINRRHYQGSADRGISRAGRWFSGTG